MKWFFWTLVFLVIIAWGLTFSFGHKGSKPAPKPVVKTLPDYVDDGAVSMTLNGRVTGQDTHREIRITVTRDYRLLEVIQGYNGQVIKSSNQPNTTEAFNVFLHSINNGGFNLKKKNYKGPTDPIGQCPAGTQSIFVLSENNDEISKLWTTTCGIGNFGGNLDLLSELFRTQITNYDELTGDVTL